MTDIERHVLNWTGASGLPGVSVFYATVGMAANADIKAFFTSILGFFPSGMQIAIPGSGDLIEDSTGDLTGVWSNPAGGGVLTGGGTGGYAAGVGMYVNWRTGTIINSRRVTGRTFLCPITAAFYQSNGTITDANLAVVQGAADTLVAQDSILIWHRPSPGGSNGDSATPAAAQVPDQVTSLRTRRR
jgi:hypothetical protein